nr:hypothetical protein [Microbacterium ulmi]
MDRVLVPDGVLPQAAHRLDARSAIRAGEVAIAVDYLNLDSASMRDLLAHNGDDPERVKAEVRAIVAERGKMTNPRTGSGGMLVGTIIGAGPGGERTDLAVGDRVATLISLTATPLALDDGLDAWDGRSEIVPARGFAIVPSARTLCRLPEDVPIQTALSILDVCGAPAHVARLAERPMIAGRVQRMLLLGGGKSAVLASAAARRLGIGTICAVPSEAEAERLRALDLFDDVVVADATRPGTVRRAVLDAGDLPDLTLVCVNAPGCEHAALVSTRSGGAVVYFSMATSFTAVALGAEALCLDVDLYVGTGYVPGHAELALDLFRRDHRVRAFFERTPTTSPNRNLEHA